MRISQTFQVCKAMQTYTFPCPKCGKGQRKRTFRAEFTVNPFNTKEDGTPKTVREVYQDAKEEVVREQERFKRSPLCFACEEALTPEEREKVRQRRVLGK